MSIKQAKITIDCNSHSRADLCLVAVHGISSEREATIKRVIEAFKQCGAWSSRSWMRHDNYAWTIALSTDLSPSSSRDLVKAFLSSADLKVG